MVLCMRVWTVAGNYRCVWLYDVVGGSGVGLLGPCVLGWAGSSCVRVVVDGNSSVGMMWWCSFGLVFFWDVGAF